MEKCEAAKIVWRPAASGEVPTSAVFEDVYFSSDDGLAESRYVFLAHNALAERFKTASSFLIVETGFGTGLNFLLTCQMWLETAPTTAVLHYLSVEKYPLTPEDLQRVWQHYPSLTPLAEALLAGYPALLPGRHDVVLFEGRVHLTLWWADVQQALPQLSAKRCVDAWFLDGFAPAKNPDMWQETLFAQMQRLSGQQTTFATFTAAGFVRRALAEAGFEVQKDSGFGKKREMCFGTFTQAESAHGRARWVEKAPWFAEPSSPKRMPAQALVVGAGLAGATVAYALAQAGVTVTVLEAESRPAKQASGNAAGAIHPLVTADWNLRSEFYLQGFETTLRWLRPWLAAGEVEGALNGLMQLAVTETMQHRLQQAVQRVGLPQSFAQWCSAQQASKRVGCETSFEGLYFPQGGWVRPGSVVERCLAHPKVRVLCDHEVTDFGWQSAEQTWQVAVQTAQGRQTFQAPMLCFATGALADALHERLQLPIRPVKGQVTTLHSEEACPNLQTTVTHRGYSVQIADQTWVTGATFEAPDRSKHCQPASDVQNWTMLTEALPAWQSCDVESVLKEGRVSFRPTTPDHLPILGAVPDAQWMQTAYFTQKPGRLPQQYPLQRYQSGLYVSAGHGPRGLMSVFLAAEEIVRQLQGEASWLPNRLRYATHPARFQIRAWQKAGVSG